MSAAKRDATIPRAVRLKMKASHVGLTHSPVHAHSHLSGFVLNHDMNLMSELVLGFNTLLETSQIPTCFPVLRTTLHPWLAHAA